MRTLADNLLRAALISLNVGLLASVVPANAPTYCAVIVRLLLLAITQLLFWPILRSIRPRESLTSFGAGLTGATIAMTFLKWNCQGSGRSLSSSKMTHLARLLSSTKSQMMLLYFLQ